MKEFSLKGKNALITGGGRGIGRAIALTFAEAGADVAVTARTMNQLEDVADEIHSIGKRSLAFQADISNPDSVREMVAGVINEFGVIDILVNNAGISTTPFSDPLSDAAWHQVIETNLSGPFYCCRAVSEGMKSRHSGSIINISSISGAMATGGSVAYNSSKAALNMMTKVLAMEWAGYNISVNAIGPGWFETDMSKNSLKTPEQRAKAKEGIPMGRLTDLRDLGLLAVYLASPAAEWMTGQVIYLDGGETGAFL